MRERGNMQSITLQLFPATFSLPAAILFQVSGAGSLCFERSCGGKNPQTWEEWEKPHSGTVLSSCKCWEQSIVCRELLGCMARQTLKHLLHMAQVQWDTRSRPAMQRTDLQNERLLASSLLVHSRCPFSQNMLPAVAWTHPPHTGSGAEMQSENPGRTGRNSAPSTAVEEMVHILPKKCSHWWKKLRKCGSQCCS